MRHLPILASLLLAACASQQPVLLAQAPAAAPESPLVKAAEVTVDDKTVTNNVRSALRAEAMLAGRKIEVHTADGTVHLLGAVKSPDERQRAEGLAREVHGVKDINNQLELVK